MSRLISAVVTNLHDTTNSIIEISYVRMQLPEWRVTVNVQQCVQVWENSLTRKLLTLH